MKTHPAANLFPMMNEAKLNELAEDIKTNGLLEPITICKGEVLDGRNRMAACEIAGVKPETVEYEGSSPYHFVISKNLKRRQLGSEQGSAIALNASSFLAEEARKRQAEGQRRGGEVSKRGQSFVNDSLTKQIRDHSNDTIHQAAKIFNRPINQLNKLNKLKNQGRQDLVDQVAKGEMRLKDAEKALRLTPKNSWREDEQVRRKQVEDGKTVVANQNQDQNLIAWALKRDKAVEIGRHTIYGNPFRLGEDGSRDEVCDAYRDHYLPFKPSIKRKLDDLRGKVLICSCYPDRCHGESLIKSI